MNRIRARRLHSLLRLAIDDLKKVERLPKKYTINMGKWHDYDKHTGKCHVCLAGAVLACTVKVKRTTTSRGAETNELDRQTSTINALRTGHVTYAYQVLYQKTPPRKIKKLNNAQIPGYHSNPKQWYQDIEHLYTALKANCI